MRCKPNDLCRVIEPGCFEGMHCIVMEHDFTDVDGRLGWRLDKRLHCGCGGDHWTDGASDHELMPLESPGDDAVDESLAWTKTPNQKRNESQEAYDAAVRRRRQAEA